MLTFEREHYAEHSLPRYLATSIYACLLGGRL